MPPVAYNGPNAGLVNEALSFAFGDAVMSGAEAAVLHDCEVVIDPADAESRFGWGSFMIPHTCRSAHSAFTVREEVLDEFVYDDELPDEESLWERREFDSILCHTTLYGTQRDAIDSTSEKQIRLIHEACYLKDGASLEHHLFHRLSSGGSDNINAIRGVVLPIAKDLAYCIENRAVNGAADTYYEYMFHLFRRGVWPVIWSGSWPAPGRMVVWNPRAA